MTIHEVSALHHRGRPTFLKACVTLSVLFAIQLAGCGDSSAPDDDAQIIEGTYNTNEVQKSHLFTANKTGVLTVSLRSSAHLTLKVTAADCDSGLSFDANCVSLGGRINVVANQQLKLWVLGGTDAGSYTITARIEAGSVQETFVVSVGAGLTPVISWTGGDAGRLVVTRPSGTVSVIMWAFAAQNEISGVSTRSVTYGQVPTDAFCGDATTKCDATPLIAGTTYTATVIRPNGTSAERSFTPAGASGVAFETGHGVSGGTSTSAQLGNIAVTGTNRLLICVVGVEPFNASTTVVSIALDNGSGAGAQPLTQLGAAYSTPTDGLKWSTWHLIAPTLGTGRRVAATLSASANWQIACESYSRVNQSTPFGPIITANGVAGTAELVVASTTSGSLPWGHIFSSNAGYAAGLGVTNRQKTTTGGSSFLVDGNVQLSNGASHTFRWTYAGQFGAQGATIRPE